MEEIKKELIIHNENNGYTIALLENKRLVEIHKENDGKRFCVGDLYLAKVRKVVPGLNAAFVDVGYEKDAFLHYHDLGPQFKSLVKYTQGLMLQQPRSTDLSSFKLEEDINKDGTINDIIKSGQNIIVQIAKEPISSKGPRLTSEITIAGRYLVLVPFSNVVSVSQKIKDKEEKRRLKTLIQSIKPANFGVIIRTVAEEKKVADLHQDMNELVEKWTTTFKKFKFISSPKRILGEISRTSALLRDILNASFNNIFVDDANIYSELKQYINEKAPEHNDILKEYTGSIPIFDFFGIEKQIKESFGKTVTSSSGLYLIIEHTEACHVIDVNSGHRVNSDQNQEENALQANLEAAKLIAWQLRLRDMGGIIVVDFIDMHQGKNRKELYLKMKEVMKHDRARHSILPPSKFGLVQITRQRVRPVMDISVDETCPCCMGEGKITPSITFVDELTTKLNYIIHNLKQKNITLTVHPFIYAYLTKGVYSQLFKWRLKYKARIKVLQSYKFSMLEYAFENQKGDKIKI